MWRLGYTPLRSSGRRPGCCRRRRMGRQAPDGLIGIHLNFLRTAISGGTPAGGVRAGHVGGWEERSPVFRRSGFALLSWSRSHGPRPSATAPRLTWLWRPGCSTTTRGSYCMISRAFAMATGRDTFAGDHVLDTILVRAVRLRGVRRPAYWRAGGPPCRLRRLHLSRMP